MDKEKLTNCLENIHDGYPHAEKAESQDIGVIKKLRGWYISKYFYPYADVTDDTLKKHRITKSSYENMRLMVESEILPFVAEIAEKQHSGDKTQRDRMFEDLLYLYLNACHIVFKDVFKKIFDGNDGHVYIEDLSSIKNGYDLSTEQLLEKKRKEIVKIAEKIRQQIKYQIV